jgi:hypothetical protein
LDLALVERIPISMPKQRPYFTLAIRESGRWTPQFGAYERAVVAQESRDSYAHVRKLDRKIIRTDPDCDAIDAGIAQLNRTDPLLPFAISALLFPQPKERAL